MKVYVYKQKPFPASAKKIKDTLIDLFKKHGIVSEYEVSVAIVDESEMEKLAKEYLKENGKEAREHPVLSFPTSEITKSFIFPPKSKLFLGEIVVSHTKAVEEAKSRGILIDEALCELAEHGGLHLLGIHHD